MVLFAKRITLLIALVFSVLGLVDTATAQSTPTTSRKVWTVDEIIASRQFRPIVKKPKYCQGGFFKPCVCPTDVPSIVQYRPAIAECNGKAGIVLSGKYMNVFSVVVRDRENKDRWPPTGINGCTAYERDILALNKCSAFKAQRVILVANKAGNATVHCLGASGYSTLFKRVTRMTAKLADVPNSTNDPLARWCLKGPIEALN
jgi:hypothetical protein